MKMYLKAWAQRRLREFCADWIWKKNSHEERQIPSECHEIRALISSDDNVRPCREGRQDVSTKMKTCGAVCKGTL